MKYPSMTTIFIATFLLSGYLLGADTSLQPRMADKKHLSQLRYTGVHGDRSKVADMVNLLQVPHDSDYDVTILHSLAQLGATAALPAIDQLIQKEKDPARISYFTAARARLVAEDEAKSLPTAHRATAVAAHLLAGLDLSPDAINKAVTDYNTSLTSWKASSPPEDSLPPPAPVELYVMRELADTAYRNNLVPSNVSGVNFSLDEGAFLKIRLAPMAPTTRINTLVQEMTFAGSSGQLTNYREQLLIDAGAEAHKAVQIVIQDMTEHPDRYRTANHTAGGYTALHNVLENTPSGGSASHSLSATPSTVSQDPVYVQNQFVAGY